MGRKGDKYGQIGTPRVNSASETYLRGIKKLNGRSRSSRVFLKSLVAFLMVSAVAISVTIALGVINNNKVSDNLQVISQDNYNPTFKVRYSDLGKQIIKNWYTNGLQPVPVASEITWPGIPPTNVGGTSEVVNSNEAKAEDLGDAPKIGDITLFKGERYDAKFKADGLVEGHIESLTYLVVYNDRQYLSSITLNISEDPSLPDAEKPVLTSVPTLTPYVIFGSNPEKISNEPQELDSIKEEPNDATTTAIKSFVGAWTRNDSTALKQIAQDSDPDNIYYGLGSGWQFDDTSEIKVNWRRTGIIETTRLSVLNISFDIYSLGPIPTTKEGTPDPSSRKTFTTRQSLDIVIDKYNTGLPAIVSWGPSGSWPTLDPYSNAVSSEEITMAPAAPGEEEEEVAPSESASPTPTPAPKPSPSETKKPEPKKEEK